MPVNCEALAELRGFLAAFEWMNEKWDHCYSFTIEATAMSGRPPDFAIHEHLAAWDPTDLRLTPVSDWKSALRADFAKWLLACLEDPSPGYRLHDSKGAFSLTDSDRREALLNECLDRLIAIGTVDRVWTVQFRTESFYECASNDYLIAHGDQATFLHFGCSD